MRDGDARRPFSGSPALMLEDIATYAGLGVHELIFDFRSDDLAEGLERMERFAATVKLERGAVLRGAPQPEGSQRVSPWSIGGDALGY
jgi:hypothetical protein